MAPRRRTRRDRTCRGLQGQRWAGDDSGAGWSARSCPQARRATPDRATCRRKCRPCALGSLRSRIGVRRSFGVTSGRIFSAIMLESVCATALAGLAPVAASIVVVRSLPLERLLNNGIPLADMPGFPVAAAIEGMVAATAVGALAGLLPAIIAVRAKVIDAIRL
ncbi:MAG: ABC transporter permease [Blastococcus sp.]